MERKIIVLLKFNKNYLTIDAVESVHGNFQTIYTKAKIPFKTLLSDAQQAISDIQNIIKGDINSVICCFENPEDFYVDIINLDSKFASNKFSVLDLNQLKNKISYSPNNDFLITTRILDLSVVDGDHNLKQVDSLENLIDKNILQIKASIRRSFIKNSSYVMAKTLINKLSLKVEKFIATSEAASVFTLKNFRNLKLNATINITEEAVELSLLKHNNLVDKKTLSFGFNDLIKAVSKELSIPKWQACYFIASIENLITSSQLPIMFRKQVLNEQLKKLVTNFVTNIYYELDMLLKVNNVFSDSEVNIVIYENNSLDSNTLIKILKLNEQTNNFTYATNYKITLSNDLSFTNSAIIDYLCYNIYDQDITDTFIINTNSLENVKIKKNAFKTIFKRIFAN